MEEYNSGSELVKYGKEENKNILGTPEARNVNVVVLFEDGGNTKVMVGGALIEGELRGGHGMDKIKKTVSEILELMGASDDKSQKIIEKFSLLELEGDSVVKFKITADDLIEEGLFSDQATALMGFSKAIDHFMNENSRKN